MKLNALCGAEDVLYQEVAQAFGVSVEWLKRREFKELVTKELMLTACLDNGFYLWDAFDNIEGLSAPRSPRQILQWWGDYRRAQDPDYFVKRMEEAIIWIDSATITDVRKANEAAMVRSMGGEIWQVVRPGVGAGGTGHVTDVDGSEFNPDGVILNDGTVDDLRKTLAAKGWLV